LASADDNKSSKSSGLDPQNFKPFKLKAVKDYNYNTKQFIFDLGTKELEEFQSQVLF